MRSLAAWGAKLPRPGVAAKGGFRILYALLGLVEVNCSSLSIAEFFRKQKWGRIFRTDKGPERISKNEGGHACQLRHPE